MRFDTEKENRTLKEKQLRSQTVFDGIVLHVKRDEVSLPNGSSARSA